MKLILFLIMLLPLNYELITFCQQDKGNIIYQLKVLLNSQINKKCHLTELSYHIPVAIKNENIEIKINFNNSTLRSFWSPEVAVQYIFDAALQPLLEAILNDPQNRFGFCRSIMFYVDIRPHDIPPMLLFDISKSDFLKYSAGSLSKEGFYKKINITAGGEKFKFDAHYAVGIE